MCPTLVSFDQWTIRVCFNSRHQTAIDQLSLEKKKTNKKQKTNTTLIYVALKTEFITFSKIKQLCMYYFEKIW